MIDGKKLSKNNIKIYKTLNIILVLCLSTILNSCVKVSILHNDNHNPIDNTIEILQGSNIDTNVEVKSVKNIINSNNHNVDLKNNIKELNLNIQNSDEIKLLFSGDMLISRKTRKAYNNKGILGILNKKYIDIIEDHDLFVGNLECVLSDIGVEADKQFTFRASSSYINILKDAKYDVLSVANNHSLDYGKDAFVDMLDNLNNNKLIYIGGGKDEIEATAPLLINVNNTKIAIMSISLVLPSTSWSAKGNEVGLNSAYNDKKTISQIREIKKNADKFILFIHWGVEKELVANRIQTNYAHKYIDAGVDMIIGAHSHTIQNIEYYKGKPILYSLGNFIYGSTDTETALLSVVLNISNKVINNDFRIKLYPGISLYEYTKPYSKTQKLKFIENLMINSINSAYDYDTDYIVELDKDNILELETK